MVEKNIFHAYKFYRLQEILYFCTSTYDSRNFLIKFRKTINADYDEFWKSLGATKEDKIFWSLPEEIVRKNIEDIESKKRSQYRSRYKILDELKELVEKFMNETKN